ncbi:MAG: tyrosinase family protein [Chloroflexota bacterium]
MVARKRASQLAQAEQQRFVSGVNSLIQNGTYGQLVAIHSDMQHMQHGSMGPIGRERFLPWHRDFLRKFEQALQALDAQSFVPYWQWTDDRTIPSFLATVLPAVSVPGVRNPIHVHRSLGRRGRLPSGFEIDAVVTHTNLTYTNFTTLLEGFHNDVHNFVGGTMGNIMVSPADPVFWLHHAQMDRLWSVWQAANTGKHPNLTGVEDTLDPWNETHEQVGSIAALGYSYQ